MLKRLGFLMLIALSACNNSSQLVNNQNYTNYVDPFIGSELHGHVFVGANVPFGAVQLGPSQIMRSWDQYGGWDWCSGYNYVSEEILGFTHTHLSGTGIGDLNDILVLPMTGKPDLKPMKFEEPETGYGSPFKKSNEIAQAGYYSAYLDKYQVKAELTASERVGFHQYHFESDAEPFILLDLEFGMGWDSPVETYMKVLDNNTIVGYRFSKGWSSDQRVFFALKTSDPFERADIFENTDPINQTEWKGKATKAHIYPLMDGKTTKVKVGISPVSYENALLNIETEVPHWDFEQTKKEADEKWERTLRKIEIEAVDSVKTIFYTGLFHAHIAPSLFNDANSDYRGSDKQVYENQNFQNYTTFSLWDTYRGHSPLMTVINPDIIEDFAKSLVKISEQQNALAMWPLHGSETYTMVGNPAAIQIADAYLKGLISEETAKEAFDIIYKVTNHKTEAKPPVGQKWVTEMSWIPADDIVESVAWGMEFAIADDAISKMAGALGENEKAKEYAKRAELYKLYFDEERGFFNGRLKDGSFRKDFNEFSAEHRQNDYIEGNAWQYLFLVPHQVYTLMDMLGGEESFINKLDTFFTTELVLEEEDSNDITGLIGQYAHGNEPSHHVAYLYTYAGQQWKTAEMVRKIMKEFYTTKPDGLIGNEDAGQMSSWYMLSALGFYSANPISGQFVFGSPIVDRADIPVRNGKTFTILSRNNTNTNIYIQSIKLNGEDYTKSYISYEDIMSGGTLEFVMGKEPNKEFGIDMADRPE